MTAAKVVAPEPDVMVVDGTTLSLLFPMLLELDKLLSVNRLVPVVGKVQAATLLPELVA